MHAEGSRPRKTVHNAKTWLDKNIQYSPHYQRPQNQQAAGDGSGPRDFAAWRRDPVRELDPMQ